MDSNAIKKIKWHFFSIVAPKKGNVAFGFLDTKFVLWDNQSKVPQNLAVDHAVILTKTRLYHTNQTKKISTIEKHTIFSLQFPIGLVTGGSRVIIKKLDFNKQW